MGKALNERVVKIEESKNFLDFHDVCWCRPGFNSSTFYWVHACHPLFKDYPQVIHGWCMECALLWFKVQFVVFCDAKNIAHHGNMCFHIGTCCNPDVVHVYADCCALWFMFQYDILVDMVHHHLKCGWQVCKAKVHNHGFIEAISHLEGCFIFISFPDSNIIVPPMNIKFHIYVGIAQILNEV